MLVPRQQKNNTQIYTEIIIHPLTLLASVVANPTACAIYPMEFHIPTSNPANVAPRAAATASSSVSWVLTFLGGWSNHGKVRKDANPKRKAADTPTGMVSPKTLTKEKFVPYNAAATTNNKRAFQMAAASFSSEDSRLIAEVVVGVIVVDKAVVVVVSSWIRIVPRLKSLLFPSSMLNVEENGFIVVVVVISS